MAIDDLKAALEWFPFDGTLQAELRSAELNLKELQRKNYCKILGVEKDAGNCENNKAYRRKALENHPDKNPDDKGAKAWFKDVGEAYTFLIVPQKKARYDSGADLKEGQPGIGGMGGMDPNETF